MKNITERRKKQWIEIRASKLCWEKVTSETRANCMKQAREEFEQLLKNVSLSQFTTS